MPSSFLDMIESIDYLDPFEEIVMTNESRATKMIELAQCCDWVDGQMIDEFGYAILSWSPPKTRQFATIDTRSGEITRYVQQSGTTAKDAPPNSHQQLIDRRINYLADRHGVRTTTANKTG